MHTKAGNNPFVCAARLVDSLANVMQFFNPLILIGLVAAAIPILLHLLNLRRLKTIEFSTLRFFNELQKSHVRRLKLQQWMLLVVRTLLVVFAVLAFARPVVRTSLPVLGGQARSSVVIILDNTASMDTRDSRGNRFRWAVRQAEQILSGLKSGDEVALVTPSAVLAMQSLELTTALGAVREQLTSLPLCYGTVPLDQLLDIANTLLANAHNAHRELYIISDFQQNLFPTHQAALTPLRADRVIMLPAARAAELEQLDLGLDSVWIGTQLLEPNKTVEVVCAVRNNSQRPARGTVARLRFNGIQVAQRAFDVEPQQVHTVVFSAAAPMAGFVSASVELEADACESNNVRTVAFLVPPFPRVLLVGTREQVGYLQAALAALQQSSAAGIGTVQPERLASVLLDEYDLVVLTSPVRGVAIERVRAYLTQGRGNLLVFADAQVEPVEQEQFARSLGIGRLRYLTAESGQSYRLQSVDDRHPLFAGVFRAERSTAAQIESPAIEQALISTEGIPLVTMEEGAFLSEHIVGEGRVLYCALPPTMEWSNFPATGLFPVLIGRAVLYLSAREGIGTFVQVGMACRLEIPKRYATSDAFRIRDGSGAESLQRVLRVGGSVLVDLGRQLQPGTLAVLTASGEPVAAATVGMPSSEAILHFVPIESAQQQLVHLSGVKEVELPDENQSLATIVARQRRLTELWPWLLALALCCAVAEMVIAGRLARRTTAM